MLFSLHICNPIKFYLLSKLCHVQNVPSNQKSNICKRNCYLLWCEIARSPIHCFQVKVPYQIAFISKLKVERINVIYRLLKITTDKHQSDWIGMFRLTPREWQRTNKTDWYEISELCEIFMVFNSSIQWLMCTLPTTIIHSNRLNSLHLQAERNEIAFSMTTSRKCTCIPFLSLSRSPFKWVELITFLFWILSSQLNWLVD